MADRLLVDVGDDGRVSVSAQLEGGLPDPPVGPPVELVSPLDDEALYDIRWYLEDYLRVPFGVYGDRGDEVAGRLESWGTDLFAAVFGTGPARDAYERLKGRDRPIELIVRSSSPAALGLPWELLRDPAAPTPLALDLAGMSRSLPGLPASFEASGDGLRVLMVIARPRGAEDVGYQMVARPLLRRLEAVRGEVDLVVLRPPTIDAFERALRTASDEGRPFQVVHFDGHGVLTSRRAGGGGGPHMYAPPAGEGLLQFERSGDGDDDGLVPAARFALAVKDAKVPLVVLNACQSAAMGDQVEAAVATRLLQEGVAAVVAMGYSVYAVAAAEFMAAFYERLFAGDGVTAAVAAGRRRLAARPLRPSPKGKLPLSDWMVPVHYLHREVHFPHLVRTSVPPDGPKSLDDRLDRIRSRPVDGDDKLAAAGGFVGRDAEFYELERLARERRVVVVHGSGGSGKTELAKAFGRWWRATGGVERPEHVVWHSFEPGVASFGLDGALSAVGLQIFGPDFARLEADERWAVVVDVLREERLLLIWDNVETIHTMPDPTGATPPLGEAEREELRSFLAAVAAPGGRSAVLLTSRTREAWLGEVSRLELGGLAEGDRAEYTDHLVGSDPAARARRDDRAFGELLEWLAGHPLSMRLVLPHLATTDAATLLAGLQGTEPLPVDADREESRTTSLPASITYSFDHLDQRERALLTAVSLFHGVADADVLGLFSAVDDVPDRFKEVDLAGWVTVLDHAADLGLLASIGSGMYEIHPALPAFLAALWRADHPDGHADELSRATEALLTAYGGLCSWLGQQIHAGDAGLAFAVIGLQRRTLGFLLGHALATRQWSVAHTLAAPLNSYWDSRGLLAEADSWGDRIRAEVETPDGDPPSADGAAGALWIYVVGAEAARALRRRDLDRAHQLSTRLLGLLERQPPDDTQRQRIAFAAHQLGVIAETRGDPDAAASWYRRSLTISEQLGDRSGQSMTYHHLGILAQMRGAFDEAQDGYRRSLEISEDLGDRPGQAMTYHQLGNLAEARGALDEAQDWYRRSLDIEEAIGDRSGQAITYHQLGILAYRRGAPDEAEGWFHRSLEIKEAIGDRSGQAVTYHQLGMVAEMRGALGDAEDWYQRSLLIKNELGDRRGQATTYHQLGMVAQRAGDLEAAEDWFSRSLTIEVALGRPPELALTYAQLGLLAEERGQPREAVAWNVRCVALFEEFPSPHTGSGPSRLVALTGQLGMPVLAEVWREVVGEELPEHVRTVVEQVLGETEEAGDDDA